jgi:hypothetical protein
MGVEEKVLETRELETGRPIRLTYLVNSETKIVEKKFGSEIKMCWIKYVRIIEAHMSPKQDPSFSYLTDRHYQDLGCDHRCDGFQKEKNCYIQE